MRELHPDADEPDSLKSLLKNLLGYEFYRVDPQSGKFHEVAPDMKQEYWTRLDDLAQDIAALLNKMLAPDASDATKPVLYIADTSLDLKDDRAAVRRDLERRGYTVLPSRPLALDAEELNSFVQSELARADLSVHMVGVRYGLVPDGSELSIVETQLALAAQRAKDGGFVRLVWLPPGLGTPTLEVQDARNQTFLDRLRADGGWGKDADLLETGLESLKSSIDDHLQQIEEARKAAKAPAPPSSAGAAAGQIYLVCDQPDQQAVAALKNFLFDRGFEITLPLFDGDEADIRSEHEEALNNCDGVIVYYGAANELSLRKKLRDLQKCMSDRKQSPRARAICVAPPITDGKRDYRTHDALVIQQTTGFQADAWAGFLSAMKGSN